MNEKVAQALVDANVVKFGIFTLTSGAKSPVYADIRILPSTPSSMKVVAEELAEMTKKMDVNKVAGAETAGIPLAAAIALKNEMPMVYVRKRPKRYGTNQMIEGVLDKGDKVVLVDDMMTDGRSKLVFIDGIRETGAIVDDVIIVLDREQGGKAILENEGVKLHALITLKELMEYMRDKGLVAQEKYDQVLMYLENSQK